MKMMFTFAALGMTIAGGISVLNMPMFVPGAALQSANFGLGIGALAGLSLAGLANDDNPFAFIGGAIGGLISLFGGIAVAIMAAQSFESPMKDRLLTVITERHGQDMRRLRTGQEIAFNLQMTGGVDIPLLATAKADSRIDLISAEKNEPINVRACADFTVAQRNGSTQNIEVTVCNTRPLRFDETIKLVQSLNP